MYPLLINIASEFEGFHKKIKYNEIIMAEPYICPAGFWTIGYGHLCSKDQKPITLPQAELWLDADLTKSLKSVLELIRTPLTENQIIALTDFTFNLGSGRLRGSTMRSKINRGELEDIPKELRRWVYGGGKKLPGLVARREVEAILWAS